MLLMISLHKTELEEAISGTFGMTSMNTLLLTLNDQELQFMTKVSCTKRGKETTSGYELPVYFRDFDFSLPALLDLVEKKGINPFKNKNFKL